MLSILRFGVCRSSDLSIHVQRILSFTQTHCFSLLSGPWQPFQWPIFTARRLLCMEDNTLEIQLLSEFCLHLCILWFIGCKRREEIPSVSGILTRFPCSANKHACPISRVAHLPQKPWYVILGTIIDFPCLAKCQTKEVLVSDNIRFACTQKWQT